MEEQKERGRDTRVDEKRERERKNIKSREGGTNGWTNGEKERGETDW